MRVVMKELNLAALRAAYYHLAVMRVVMKELSSAALRAVHCHLAVIVMRIVMKELSLVATRVEMKVSLKGLTHMEK